MAHHTLVIDTAAPQSQIALAGDHQLLAQTPVYRTRRHGVELIAAIDLLLKPYQLGPGDIDQITLALGPGSFTGLRIGLSTVKMLALAAKANPPSIVGVSSLEVLHVQHPQAIVCLQTKRQTTYCMGPGWPAQVREIERIGDRGLPMVGQNIEGAKPPTFSIETLWHLGRERAAAGQFDHPATLRPLYVREPEAATLWREKSGSA